MASCDYTVTKNSIDIQAYGFPADKTTWANLYDENGSVLYNPGFQGSIDYSFTGLSPGTKYKLSFVTEDSPGHYIYYPSFFITTEADTSLYGYDIQYYKHEDDTNYFAHDKDSVEGASGQVEITIQVQVRGSLSDEEDSNHWVKKFRDWKLRDYPFFYNPDTVYGFEAYENNYHIISLIAQWEDLGYHLQARLEFYINADDTQPYNIKNIDGYSTTETSADIKTNIPTNIPTSDKGEFDYWILKVDGREYHFKAGETDVTFRGATAEVVYKLVAHFKSEGATCWIYTQSGWKEAIPWVCLGKDQNDNPIWKECSAYIYDNGWQPLD